MTRAAQARDRAAEWIVARDEPDWTEADAAALCAWLKESDMNRIAFARLEHSWREADRIGALGAAAAPPPTRRRFTRVVMQWPRWLPIGLAASLLLAIGIGAGGLFDRSDVAAAAVRIDTGVGQRKLVALADGSRMELNTASLARAAVGGATRDVWLEEGEAYFEVAHDAGRPFVLHAGERQVTVLGTKFAVRRDRGRLSVFVREGRVRVDDMAGAGAGRSTTITGGDIAISWGGAMLVTAKSDLRVEGALAWRGGMLDFDRQPLSEVAAEFNRYNRQHLVVTDTVPREMRIGGTFPAKQPAQFARLLRDAYGLNVRETPDAIIISN